MIQRALPVELHAIASVQAPARLHQQGMMQRRRFLHGLGGAAVATPFLNSLRPLRAQQSLEPQRLIVMFTHHGCLTDAWFPTTSHGPLGEADYAATSLEPVAGFATKLLMPRGIRGINEWSFNRDFGQETDPHSQPMGSFFTAYPVDRTSGLDTGTLDFDKLNALPFGRSMDHYIADQINPPGVGPLVVHFGGVRDQPASNLSYSAPLTSYPGVGTPSALFANLTNLGGDVELSSDSYKVARGKSVIDVIRGDLDYLQSQKMSRADQNKLEHWKELLHDTTDRVRPALCTEATATDLGISSAAIEAAEAESTELPVRVPLMTDLAVLTALCDLNRVMLLQFPTDSRFEFLQGMPAGVDHHGLSHRIVNPSSQCAVGVNDVLAAIDRWHAEQFAYLLGRLDSFEESEGTLLDNSATVWMMAHSDGSAHNNNNLPLLHAGHCGGYFKTGMAVNVEDGTSDLTPGYSSDSCDNSTAVSTDGPINGGTPSNIANAPINKYLYNLMNAVGVKGNADGFPEPGGTGPVHRFGWSDDPRHFANFVPSEGIETQPGSIVDPGEFADLLA